FSNSTLNIALGKVSNTVACTSIASSFDISSLLRLFFQLIRETGIITAYAYFASRAPVGLAARAKSLRAVIFTEPTSHPRGRRGLGHNLRLPRSCVQIAMTLF